jgi:hypothetical protein
MANVLDRNFEFATNGTVTAAGLHNLIDDANIYAGLISTQEETTSVGTGDLLLVANSSSISSPQIAANRTTVYNLFDDALTGGTYTNAQLAGNLTYGTATGQRTISTSATITNGTITNGTIASGTIPTLTAGTTTSTAANITNGTVQTLTASTATISQGSAILTQGTIATLNSTTGTIANLSATTSTFLGTITGSTNVINIGSGQISKDASGNVGIGTTSPSNPLHIVAASSATSGEWDGGTDFIRLNATGSFSEQAIAFQEENFNIGAKIGVKNTGNASYDIIFANRASTSATSPITEKVRIANAGQIGIGGANYGTSGQVLTSGGSAAAPSWQTAAGISRGTATASTTGTAIDFTGIPSGVKRITVMFSGVSTNGASIVQVQLGDSGGIEATGYLGASSNLTSTSNSTTGIAINYASAANIRHGSIVFTNVTSNSWVANGNIALSDSTFMCVCAGSKQLSDTLTSVRVTTVNGTDTFDAGTVNILYES